MSVLLYSIFKKLVGMTLLSASISKAFLQSNTALFLSSAVALLLFFLAQNAAKSSIPFGHLKRQSKEAKLLFPLIEEIKSTRLTSQSPFMPRPSSPNQRLRHDIMLVSLFYLLHPTVNQSTLSFDLLLLLAQLSQMLFTHGVGIGLRPLS